MKYLPLLILLTIASCSKEPIEYNEPLIMKTVAIQPEPAAPVVATATTSTTTDVAAAPTTTCEAGAFVDGYDYENIAYDIHYNTSIEGVRLEGVVEAIILIEDLDFGPLTDKLQNTTQIFELNDALAIQGAQGYAIRETTCNHAHAKYHERMLNNDNQSLDFFAEAQSEIVSRLMIHELAHVVHFDFENETWDEVQNMYEAAKDMYPGEVDAQEYWTVNGHEFLAEIITALGTTETFPIAFGYDHPALKLYEINEIRIFIDNYFIN